MSEQGDKKVTKPSNVEGTYKVSKELQETPRQFTIDPKRDGGKGKAYSVIVGSEGGKGISIPRTAPKKDKVIKEATQKELKYIHEILGYTELVTK